MVPAEPSKPALRQSLLARRAALQRADQAGAAIAAIGQHVLALAQRERPVCVAAYWPIRDEPDLSATWAALRAAGIRTALPVVEHRDQPLAFRHWDGGLPAQRDRAGVPAPLGAPLAAPDWLVMPCVGFHAAGYRLGYGGGYYDRSGAALPNAKRIGIAFSEQQCVFDIDAHDLRLDWLITERGAHEFVRLAD